MWLSEVPILPCQSPGFALSPQRHLGNPGYLHSLEMGSSSNVSPRSVCVPSVTLAAVYAASAWPLVAVDAFDPVADDTLFASNGTLLVLDGTLLAFDGTLLPVVCALPLVMLALDGPLLATTGAHPLVLLALDGPLPPSVGAPSPADDLPPAAERPVR